MKSIWPTAPTLPNSIYKSLQKRTFSAAFFVASSALHACMDTAQEAKRPDEGPFNFHHARSRCWNVKRRRKHGTCGHHMIPCDYASSEAIRRQNLISSSPPPPPPPPLMHVMKYMVPSMLSLATLKYQSKTDSLFLENPAPVWCFLAATCVYWLIVGAMKQRTAIEAKWFHILSRAALTTAVLSVLSLVSMFLPYHFSRVPLLIWLPLPLALAWPSAYGLLHRGIISVMDKIHGMVVCARRLNFTEESSNLPV